jgi:hypothetical protein
MQQNIVRPKEDQNFWNFLFSLFFIAVLVGALWWMHQARGGYLSAVPVFDAVMLAFASFRITRLIVYDKIARWFRELFASRREFVQDGLTYVEVTPFKDGFRHTIYDLLHCPWCIGIWSSLIVVVAYFIFDWAWSVIFFLALAGAGTLIQLWANKLGWQAENDKLDVNMKEKAGHTSDRSGL